MAFYPPSDAMAARTQFARDVAALSLSVSPEQLRATPPHEAHALIDTLVQVLQSGGAADSTTNQCVQVLSTVVQSGDEFVGLLARSLDQSHLLYLVENHTRLPSCIGFLELLAWRLNAPVMLSLAQFIVDAVVQEVTGSEELLLVLSSLLRSSEQARDHVQAHPLVKGFYRILIQQLCSEQVDVIVQALCVLGAMAHHDPQIRDKLFSPSNVHQSFQLIVNLVANCEQPGARSALVAVVEFMLRDESMAATLEQYSKLEESLARLLPFLSTPASAHTMGTVELLSTIAMHSPQFQGRVAALLTNFGASLDKIVEALLDLLLGNSARLEAGALARLLTVMCPVEQVSAALCRAARPLEMVVAAALHHGSDQDHSYSAPTIEAAAALLQGIWTFGAARLRVAVGTAMANAPQAPRLAQGLLARAAGMAVVPQVEMTALDVTLLALEALPDPFGLLAPDQVASMLSGVLLRSTSGSTVQKALKIATKLDSSVVASAMLQARGLHPPAPPMLAAPRSPPTLPAPAVRPADPDTGLPVEMKLAEEATAREHALEHKLLVMQAELLKLQAQLEAVSKSHTPRKPGSKAALSEVGEASELQRVRGLLAERERELEEAYRKLVVISKAYSTSADEIESAQAQNQQLRELVKALEEECDSGTAELRRELEAAESLNSQLQVSAQTQAQAMDLAHKGRDTAEDAKRQLHASLRQQVLANQQLQKDLEAELKRVEDLTSELQGCQQAIVLGQQELQHTRRECSDAHARAQHFEAEMRSHRNVLRKTSEFTAMIHSLSGEELSGAQHGRVSPPGHGPPSGPPMYHPYPMRSAHSPAN